jgi:hypothetical protein
VTFVEQFFCDCVRRNFAFLQDRFGFSWEGCKKSSVAFFASFRLASIALEVYFSDHSWEIVVQFVHRIGPKDQFGRLPSISKAIVPSSSDWASITLHLEKVLSREAQTVEEFLRSLGQQLHDTLADAIRTGAEM